MNDRHYGTVSHWFDEGQVGAIRPDEAIGRHILLIAKHLPHGYLPQIGDEVSYNLGRDERNRECATAVEVLPGLREGARIRIKLAQWDLSLNGGYGLYQRQKPLPVFVLGQFLRDQTRVPEEGEHLHGTLMQHANGQWLMTDIEAAAAPAAPPTRAVNAANAAGKTQPEKPAPQAAPLLAKPQPVAAKTGGLPLKQVLRGEVVRWEDDKGYGFIQSGTQSVFFHISAYHYRQQRPQLGEAVSFFCNFPAEQGEKQRAARVVRQQDEHALNQHEALAGAERKSGCRSMLCAIPGLVYLAAVAFFFWPLALAYLAISLAATALYGYDKTVARKRAGRSGYAGRIRESTLLTAGMCGGWPGALAARHWFNHKTTKQPFVTYFWLTAAANAALTAWLLHSGMREKLAALLPGL
ncbi:MAG: DUF1294 domain-containing protein [Neisseria sp.]|nr:DUF1294 domain-containing protein [Neisseria sp.]